MPSVDEMLAALDRCYYTPPAPRINVETGKEHKIGEPISPFDSEDHAQRTLINALQLAGCAVTPEYDIAHGRYRADLAFFLPGHPHLPLVVECKRFTDVNIAPYHAALHQARCYADALLKVTFIGPLTPDLRYGRNTRRWYDSHVGNLLQYASGHNVGSVNIHFPDGHLSIHLGENRLAHWWKDTSGLEPSHGRWEISEKIDLLMRYTEQKGSSRRKI